MCLPTARRTTRLFDSETRGLHRRRWARARVSLCQAVEADPGRRAEAEPEWARRVAPVSLLHCRRHSRSRQRRHAAALLHGPVRPVHLLHWNNQRRSIVKLPRKIHATRSWIQWSSKLVL